MICLECSNKLQDFYDFQQMIKRVDLFFKEGKPVNALSITKYDSVDSKDIKEDIVEPQLFVQCDIMESITGDHTAVANNPKSEKENEIVENSKDKPTNNNKKTNPNPTSGNENVNEQSGSRKRFQCGLCSYTTRYKRNLVPHQKTHTGEKPHSCHICQKKFVQKIALKMHLKRHDKGAKPLSCEICLDTFRSYNTLMRHKMKEHGIQKKLFPCPVCGKNFFCRGELNYHMAIHNDDKSFVCDICGMTFKTSCNMYRHQRNHSEQVKEKCPLCPKMFIKIKMKTHLKTHTKGPIEQRRKYVCQLCGRGFTEAKSRNRHMVVHTGEKPHACLVCNKTFAQREGLWAHKKVHSDAKPFACTLCPTAFKYKRQFTTHLAKYHGNFSPESSLLIGEAIAE